MELARLSKSSTFSDWSGTQVSRGSSFGQDARLLACACFLGLDGFQPNLIDAKGHEKGILYL